MIDTMQEHQGLMQARLESIAAQLTRAEELQNKDPEAAALLRAIALEWLESLRSEQ